jgi:hypothetical protein
MVPKTVFTAVMCATLLAWSGVAAADEYRPDQFLGLDLSKALLSPKPLGPPAQFVPGPIEPGADPGQVAQAGAEPKPAATVAAPKRRVATRVETRVAHLRAEKPRAAVRTTLARRHTNPLDAQAFDTRIQVWPCRSGGICNWQPSGR